MNEARAGTSGNARGLGGAIYSSGGSLDIESSTFSENLADSGSGTGTTRALGGAIYNSNTPSTLTDCEFVTNRADVNGGGVYNTGSAADTTIVGCTFRGNFGILGSGVFNINTGSGSTIFNCRFIGNLTGVSGGIYNDTSSPDVTNCIFVGNSASSFGGGIFNFDNSDPTVTNCTFALNEAFAGSAIHNFDSNSTTSVMNCVTWGNINANGTDLDGNGAHTVSFSNIEGGFAGTGNIDTDPMFIDADGPDDVPGTDDDNVRLAEGSPCIDTGSNGLIPVGVIVDLDGNDRIIDGDGVGGAVVDMGAYEAPPPMCFAADFDGDGQVGINDFLQLLKAWGPCGSCPEDIDGDGTVGINDFLALLANWGPCP